MSNQVIQMSHGLSFTFNQSTVDTFPSPGPSDGSTDYAPYIVLTFSLSYLAFTAIMILRGFRFRTTPEVDIESEAGRSLLDDMIDVEDARDRATWDRESAGRESAGRLVDRGFEESLPEYSREYREVDDDALSPPLAYEEGRELNTGWHCSCGVPECTLFMERM
jgi:hypothetical protein